MSSPTESQDSVNPLPEFLLETDTQNPHHHDSIYVDALEGIQALKAREFSNLTHTAHSTSTVEPFANAIIAFLTHIREMNPRTVQVFAQLIDLPFMLLLFDNRKMCRYDGQIFRLNSSTVCVCWVDVLLSKLAEFSVALVKEFIREIDNQDVGPSIRLQRENDAVKAAAQLPEDWTQLPTLLASGKLSRAAHRLSLRLLFAVYVMGPQLSASGLSTSDQLPLYGLAECACSLLDQYARILTPFECDERPPTTDDERAMWAIALCLLAAAEEAQGPQSISKFRPRSIAQIGEVATFVMHCCRETEHGEIVVPLGHLDFPQKILVNWGCIAQWFCRIWFDQRNNWIVQWMCDWTAHCCSRRTFDGTLIGHNELIRLIRAQPAPLLDIFTLVLRSFLQAYPDSLDRLEERSYRLICKTSWSISQILQVNGTEFMVDQLSTCAHQLLLLWTSMSNQVELLQVRDHILEALTEINPRILQGCIRHLQRERSFHFNSKLDIEATRLRRLLDASPIGRKAALETKYFLCFMTIVWHLGSKGCLSGGTITSLATSIIGFIQENQGTSDVNIELLSATLYALSLEDSGFALSSCQGRTLWRMALTHSRQSLTAVGGFANFVLSTPEDPDILLCAEAWDLLRETLLGILRQEQSDVDNPLALLIAPTICAALSHLLDIQRQAASFSLASPWTKCLTNELEVLLDGTRSNKPYTTLLRDRLSACARILLELIAGDHKTRITTHTLNVMHHQVGCDS